MKGKKKKTSPNISVIEGIEIGLKASQKVAFKEIVDFFEGGAKNKFLLLSGSAGTGKTYLVGKYAEYLRRFKKFDILMCAPTNKAVKVLRENIEYTRGIDFSTIHSALGLREQIDDNGNLIFVNERGEDAVKIIDYDFVILDESSMVDDVIYEKLMSTIKALPKIKILFVGDKCQIPPVNHYESVIFLDETKKTLHMPEIALTSIIRQEQFNPIIELSSAIRADLRNPNVLNVASTLPQYETGRVKFMPRDKDTFIGLVEKYFVTDDFNADANYCKFLGWTNEIVNKSNAAIRRIKYGLNCQQLVTGEKMIFDKPWTRRDHVVYTTNEEITVSSFMSESVQHMEETLFYFLASVCKEGSTIVEKEKIKILKAESLPTFNKLVKLLKERALAHEKGTMPAKLAWVDYFKFTKMFAAIKYGYAITVHKSQGSTYTNAIVANYDIDKNSDVFERNRIKYTAITRPKENLFILL